MSSTALGAGAEKAQELIFISEAHEKFYYEKLKEVRYQDVYHNSGQSLQPSRRKLQVLNPELLQILEERRMKCFNGLMGWALLKLKGL